MTLICFWPVTRAQFLNYDDQEYVTANPVVEQGLSWQGLKWAFTTRHACNWHPITWISHMLDVQLFGTGPRAPHCVNLLLHAANSILLFLQLKRMTGERWRSAAVAALFAVHPLHVESVAWVAERKDVLSTFFGFLTLLAYSKYVSDAGKHGCERSIQASIFSIQGGRGWYALAVIFFACGLMSKPMLVTLPFVMLLLDYWPLRRMQCSVVPRPHQQSSTPVLHLVLEKLPLFLMSAAACAVTAWAQKSAIQPLEHLRLGDRIGNALVAYTRYLWKTIWPVDLALPYLHPGHWPAIQVIAAVFILSALSFVAVRAAAKRPYFLTGWCWFLGTLIPVIGVVQVGTQAMADRYTYLPLIGVFMVFVWGFGDVWRDGRAPAWGVIMGASAILISCSLMTFRQAGFWKDSETLFKHADAVTKDNFIAVANVGGVYFEAGRLDEAMEWYRRSHQMNPGYPEAVNSIGAVFAARGSDEAIEWFRKALELQPSHPQALFNLGNAMAKKGDTRAAIEYFGAAVRAKPDNHEARNNLGNALLKLERIDEAIVQYRAALKEKSQTGLIHKNLGEALAAKGKLEEAVFEYHEALRYTNDAATHYSLGMTLAVQGKWEAAIEQYADTLRLSPTNAEAHYNLGYALAQRKRVEEAETHFREALRFRPQFPIAHYNLACVLADKGRKEEAVAQLREALVEKPDYEEAREKMRSLGLDSKD